MGPKRVPFSLQGNQLTAWASSNTKAVDDWRAEWQLVDKTNGLWTPDEFYLRPYTLNIYHVGRFIEELVRA